MNTREAEAIFDGLGKNVMTPYRIECGWIGDQPYEIAEGEGFDNELIVGVSVLQSTSCPHEWVGASAVRGVPICNNCSGVSGWRRDPEKSTLFWEPNAIVKARNWVTK